MKKWQKNRNYRRIKDQNDTVISYVITVDGIDIEVTEEVFCVYAQADRRERYITEEQEKGMGYIYTVEYYSEVRKRKYHEICRQIY